MTQLRDHMAQMTQLMAATARVLEQMQRGSATLKAPPR